MFCRRNRSHDGWHVGWWVNILLSLGLTFFKGISVEDARQGIVYKFREDSYQGKMWFRICMFSASKVYSKDRDANDYKFKYIHSPYDMPAIMRTIAPAEHLSSGNKHEMKTRWWIAANRSKQTTKGYYISFNFFFRVVY